MPSSPELQMWEVGKGEMANNCPLNLEQSAFSLSFEDFERPTCEVVWKTEFIFPFSSLTLIFFQNIKKWGMQKTESTQGQQCVRPYTKSSRGSTSYTGAGYKVAK